MEIAAKQVGIGKAKFGARIVVCSKEMPSAYGEARAMRLASADRQPRFAIEQRPAIQAISVLSPSQTLATARALPAELWIGVQSGTPPGHAKILKNSVKSGKGGRDRRRAEPPINLR